MMQMRALLLFLVLPLAGCGYHRVGSAINAPVNVRTLAVPIFRSKVQGYHTDTLRGTVLTESVAPLTYDPASGQTSSYLVTITAQVIITAHDGTVLYRNDAFGWREQYQSTQDLSGFVQEDSAAVRRMGHDFAQALVSDMLESFR